MGDPTIWMATAVTAAAVLLAATLEQALRHRAGGLRLQHELRRGAYAPAERARRAVSSSRPVPAPVPVRVDHPTHRRAA